MTDETTDSTTETVLEPAWYEPLVGENKDRAEALKSYESPDKFFDEFDSLKNRNWRDEVAGDDDKFKSQLERFTTPQDFGKSFREAQQKIRSGELKQEPPGEDADEKDLAAYREANGIPLEAKGYLEKLPEGLVLGEDDLPIAERFAAALHAKHAPPEMMHALIQEYDKFKQDEQDVLAEADHTHREETEDALRQEWQGDYRANLNLVGSLLESTFGEEAKEQLMNGRYPDGRAFMNDPKVLQGLADIARKLNPIAQLTRPGGDPQQTLDDEIGQIEKFMREHRSAYNKDDKMQARLRQLYDIRTQHQQKSA